VTFEFDTSGVSGTFYWSDGQSDISRIELATIGGPFTQTDFRSDFCGGRPPTFSPVCGGSYFVLTDGVITQWNLYEPQGFGLLSINILDFGAYDRVGEGGGGSIAPGLIAYNNDNPGIWTPTTPLTSVPAPIAGAGLPGLIFAGSGLLAWWRRGRKAA
jgi:hypothetical protein